MAEKNKKSIKICQISLDDFRVLKIWNCGMDLARSGNFSSGAISDICKEKYYNHHTYKGYGWFYYNAETFEEDLNSVIMKIKNRPAKKLRAEKILEIDFDGNILNVWDSSLQIKRELGVCRESVLESCRGNLNSAHKRVWLYQKDYTKNLLDKRLGCLKLNNKNVYIVLKRDGVVQGCWKTATEAAQNFNVTPNYIRGRCAGRIEVLDGGDWCYIKREEYDKLY